jgi:predicted nucleotidyltransferase
VTASPPSLLVGLADAGVDFVVIGAIAVVAHGHIRTTRDLDITYATDQENLDALGRALVAQDARLRGVAEVVPFVPDGRTLRGAELLTLETASGSLDLLASPPGAPPYAQLKARAEPIRIEGRAVLIASIEDLIAMKQAAGRPRDLEDIEALEAIRAIRSEAWQPR